MRVRLLRNIGSDDATLPVEIRKLGLLENKLYDLPDEQAQLLLKVNLAQAPDAPRKPGPVAGPNRLEPIPETPEEKKAEGARMQAQRDAFVEPAAPVVREPLQPVAEPEHPAKHESKKK